MTPSYTLFTCAEKVDLQAVLGHEVALQSTLRFAGFRPEELHYEDSPVTEVNAVEVMIPLDAPLTLYISPVPAHLGTPAPERFERVLVMPGQGVVIQPRVCHYLHSSERVMVLKAVGGWKFTRKGDEHDPGQCRFHTLCGVPEKQCPNARQAFVDAEPG